jgi:hypothetical protein
MPPVAERFGDRAAVVFVAAADRGAVPERLGLAVALLVVGPSILGCQLVVDDDLGARAPETLEALIHWAVSQALPTPRGTSALGVVTRREFCDPSNGLLIRRTYRGGGSLVTADEGRSLGLLAEWWAPARGRFDGGFVLGLPGCGEHTTWTNAKGRTCSGWRADLHTPPIRAKAMGDHGLSAEYGRAGWCGRTPKKGEPAGHWEGNKPFLGRIVDLIAPAFALDGRDTSNLGAHLSAFGLGACDVPAAVTVEPGAADQLLHTARAVHSLAMALDEEVARWL